MSALRVLYVDDEPDIREVAAMFIGAGRRISPCERPNRALTPSL